MNKLLFSLPERLSLAPDEGGSSEGTLNTGTSAGTENAGGEIQQPNQNAGINHEQRQKFLNMGMAKGITRTLRELGFQTDDLAEAQEALAALQNGASRKAPSQQQQQEPVNIVEHPQFVELAQSNAKLQKQFEKQSQAYAEMAKRADIARKLAVQQAAIERGVGAGQQANAFFAMYGDRFGFDEEGNIAVISRANGTEFTGVQTLDEVFSEVLQHSAFLLAPERASGSGSRQGPTTDGDEKQTDPNADWRSRQRAAMGIKKDDTRSGRNK